MTSCAEKKFKDIAVGDRAEFEEAITAATIQSFAELSGDYSPLHLDDAYAVATPFGQRLAHGMIGGLFFSKLVGMYLPGKYALYVKQSLIFRQPLFIGATVTVSGEVSAKSAATQTIEVAMKIVDKKSGAVATEGLALVKVLA